MHSARKNPYGSNNGFKALLILVPNFKPLKNLINPQRKLTNAAEKQQHVIIYFKE